MWTIFNERTDRTAREIWARQCRFDQGGLTADEVERHQHEQFLHTVQYVRERSAFYRRHLAALPPEGPAGRSLAQALAAVPMTTKDDLREAQFDVVSAPLPRTAIFYETTGTTGRSSPCPRDDVDMLHNDLALTSAYGSVFGGHGDDQFIGISGPTEVHAFGDTFGDVCHNLGLGVVKLWPHSPMVGFDRALDLIVQLRVTGLFCTPGMALNLAARAVQAGIDPAATAMRVLMLTGELVSPSLLANIGRLWGAQAHNALYASQEASVLGAVRADGRLHTFPLNNLYEVVDPAGDAAVEPDGAGVRHGELVVTSLYQGAKPLVRYRTGDLVRMSPPVAGAAGAATLEVLGRTRDDLVLDGVPYPALDVEDVLLEPFRDYLDYRIVIDRPAGRDELTLELRPVPGADCRPPAAVQAAVRQVRDRFGVDLQVRQGVPGAVTGTGAMVSWKAARITDLRADRSAEDVGEAQAALALSASRSGS